MVEGVTIQTPDNRTLKGSDGSRPRTIVQQCQLTEPFTRHVSLEMRWFSVAWEHFRAFETAGFKHIHAVTLLSLLDDDFLSFVVCLFDCANNDCELLGIQSIEHECLQQAFAEFVLCFLRFFDNFWREVLFLVMLAKNLSRYTFAAALILPLSQFLLEFFFVFFLLLALFRVF